MQFSEKKVLDKSKLCVILCLNQIILVFLKKYITNLFFVL